MHRKPGRGTPFSQGTISLQWVWCGNPQGIPSNHAGTPPGGPGGGPGLSPQRGGRGSFHLALQVLLLLPGLAPGGVLPFGMNQIPITEREINPLRTALPPPLERHYSDIRLKIFTTSFLVLTTSNNAYGLGVQHSLRCVPCVLGGRAQGPSEQEGRGSCAITALLPWWRGPPEAQKPHQPHRAGIRRRNLEYGDMKGLWYPRNTGCLSRSCRHREHCRLGGREQRDVQPSGSLQASGKQKRIK